MTCSSPSSPSLEPSGPAHAPPWLFDDLIGEVLAWSKHDKHTLATCTLVSQSWLPCASRHLFRSIHFHTLRLSQYTTHDRPAVIIDDFLAFLKSCERARSNLQELSLTGQNNDQSAILSHIRFSALQELVSILPHLTLLALGRESKLYIRNDIGMAERSGATPGLMMDKLVLGDLVRTENEHIADVLGLFSSVGELSFESSRSSAALYTNVLVQQDFGAQATRQKIDVSTLSFKFSLSDGLQSSVISAIGTMLNPIWLRRILNVSVTHFGELAQLDAFVRDVGTGLEELVLRIYSPGVDVGFQPRLTGFTAQSPTTGTRLSPSYQTATTTDTKAMWQVFPLYHSAPSFAESRCTLTSGHGKIPPAYAVYSASLAMRAHSTPPSRYWRLHLEPQRCAMPMSYSSFVIIHCLSQRRLRPPVTCLRV